MKTAKLLLPFLLVLVLLAVGVPAASTLGQRPPEPVAQPSPIATPAPPPVPTPAPQPQATEKEKSEEKKWNVEASPYPMRVETEIDEPGKLADLIVIDGNPLADIRQSEKVLYTLVNGRLFDAATMNQAGNHPAQRAKYYWEKD